MAINLKRLQEAFSKIEEINNREISFEVNGTDIVLRHVSDVEEVDVMSEVRASIKDVDESAKEQTFVHAMKVGLLSRAIVEVGGLSLRESVVDTGETDKNGRPVLIEKKKAVADLLNKFLKPYLSRIFAKYGELISSVEIESENKIKYDPVDIESEIARLEERLEELRNEKKANDISKEEYKNKVLKSAAALNEADQSLNSFMAKGVEGVKVGQEKQEELEHEQEPKQEPEQEPKQEHNPELFVAEEKKRRTMDETNIRPTVSIPPPQASVANYGREATRPEQSGVIRTSDGKEMEVFKMPTQTLSSRGRPNENQAPPQVNKVNQQMNPNFIPRKP